MKKLTIFGAIYIIILLINIISIIMPSFSWFNLVVSILMFINLIVDYFNINNSKQLIFKKINNLKS